MTKLPRVWYSKLRDLGSSGKTNKNNSVERKKLKMKKLQKASVELERLLISAVIIGTFVYSAKQYFSDDTIGIAISGILAFVFVTRLSRK